MTIFTSFSPSIARASDPACGVMLHSGIENFLLTNEPIDFVQIRTSGLLKSAMHANELLLRQIDEVLTLASPPDFANTFAVIDETEKKSRSLMEFFSAQAAFMADNTESMMALNAIGNEGARRMNRLMMNEQFSRRLAQVKADIEEHPERFTPGQKRLASLIQQKPEFSLSQTQVNQINFLQANLTAATRSFSKKFLETRSLFQVTIESENQLAGLPAALIASAKDLAVKAGKPESWIINLSGSNYLDVLRYAQDADLREKFFNEGSRTSPNIGIYYAESEMLSSDAGNFPAVRRILDMRQQIAERSGFKNYAEYRLSSLAAKSPEIVGQFLDSILKRALPQAKVEWEELLALAKKDGRSELKGADVAYYAQKLKDQTAGVDPLQLAPYFEVNQTVRNLLTTLGNTFGLEFTLRADLPTMHPSIVTYEVRDVRANKTISYLYLDLFDRPGKPGGYMTILKPRIENSGQDQAASILVRTTIRSPLSANEPVFLKIEEVRTLIHEFGHVFAAMLAESPYFGLTYGEAPWDFIEFPSKFFENFLFDKNFMKKVAHDYRTQKPIPDSLFEAFKKDRFSLPGITYLAQAGYALLDLELHKTANAEIREDLAKFEESTLGNYLLHNRQPTSTLAATFYTVFSQDAYAAAFYSYLWSEARAMGAFSVFQRTGTTRAASGQLLREQILGVGNQADPETLYRAFSGDQDALEAFFEKIGI